MARYRFKQIRLFVSADLSKGQQIALERDQAHYLLTVMRLKDGAEILVFNGRDGEWTGLLHQLSRKICSLTITAKLREQTEPPQLDYCFAPLKQARLDYMVQKAVEMGAGRLQPVMTRHTQIAKINPDRMRANVLEACEQCGVLTVPEVMEPLSLKDFVTSWPQREAGGRIIFCDEGAETVNPLARLSELSSEPNARIPLALLVGPEGGFSEDERLFLNSLDYVVAIPLGPRILRADTAAVAALAIVQATIGDWT